MNTQWPQRLARFTCRWFAWFLAVALLVGSVDCINCAPDSAAPPVAIDDPVLFAPNQLAPGDTIRLIFVGDTGRPGKKLDEVMAQVQREPKDLVVALGDLVYPFAPSCPGGDLTKHARKELERKVGAPLGDLGAPTALVLGNHDTRGRRRDPARENCLRVYAARHPSLYMPALTYFIDLGDVRLIVINTNVLTEEDGAQVASWAKEWDGEVVIAGHHVLRTYHNKARENYVLPWLEKHNIKPSLYANGHAHLLQFGVYESIPALTSGSGAKLRKRASCPNKCGKDQLWGQSSYGYAVAVFEKTRWTVTFKDEQGQALWTWRSPSQPKPEKNP